MSELNRTHDPARRSWVERANLAGGDFPIQNLPFGVFRNADGARTGIAIGDHILDLSATLAAGLFDGEARDAAHLASGASLNALMAAGNRMASALRARLSDLLWSDGRDAPRARQVADRLLVPMAGAEMLLPVKLGSFTDFLTSIYHTERGGRVTRPDNPVPPAFKYLPIAYNGRATSVRASAEPVRRPNVQWRNPEGKVEFGPCRQLDFELEVGMYVATGNALGEPISIEHAPDHMFGLCLLNDWSAPLGERARPVSQQEPVDDRVAMGRDHRSTCAVSGASVRATAGRSGTAFLSALAFGSGHGRLRHRA